MRRPDVIVTGTGRSGTSTVARILHTELGVCMGHVFRDVMPSNPQGEYEDTNLAVESRRLVNGYPFPDTPHSHPILLQRWREAYHHMHPRCSAKLRGVKSPHLSALDEKGWAEINPRLIIRTWRSKELVVASMNKWRGSHVDWAQFYDDREANMDKVLCPAGQGADTLEIRFHGIVSDDLLCELLQPHVDRLIEESRTHA